MFEGIKTLLNGAKASVDSLRQQIKTIRDKLTKTTEIASNALSTANSKANTENPVFTGSFSQNRRSGTTIGIYSHAEGYGTTASGFYSHAEGYGTTASGIYSHAEGHDTTASGIYSHAEGHGTTASGYFSHAEGHYTEASGYDSHAEGYETIAASQYQHVQGRYNIKDADGKYAHIVGNGTNMSDRSNAHTLDWDGNAWFAGTIEGTAIILKSSESSKRFKLTVNDSGEISVTELT